ncbi:MAG: phosphoribosyl-ATP diphosphatase [Woeseiaceae bacterium]|nr:phosphoribosyl-ATP diphosphatase [Woeseiaceae bacterium]
MSSEFIQQLEEIIRDRFENPVEGSYTAKLAAAGTKRIAQKVGEEGVELALASVDGDKEEIVAEAADLVYHLLVLLNRQDLSLADVSDELERRHSA